MFPSQTHLLFRGQDTAEMQHLVWPCLLFLLGFLPYLPILLTFSLLNRSVCAEQASGSVLGRSVQPSVAWWGLYRWQPSTKKAIRYKEETAPSLLLRSETVWCNHEVWVCLCAYCVDAWFVFTFCLQDFVDRKLVVSLRCGECRAGGGGVGCLRELSVTALRTTVTVTDTGKFDKESIKRNPRARFTSVSPPKDFIKILLSGFE